MPEPTTTQPFLATGGLHHTATIGAGGHTSAHTAHSAPPPGPALHTVFHQLTQSLTVLSCTAELVLEGRMTGPAAQPVRVWLQPNARQAEAALHRLREFRLIHVPATTDLIQCLTVLVLAADMLIQGQLSDSGARETYDLLRRNADRAMKSLQALRDYVSY